MILKKFGHSCIFIEDKINVLIDPGIYSNVPNTLRVDYLLITHEHLDHMDYSRVKRIIKSNPKVSIVSNSSVLKLLSSQSISISQNNCRYVKMRSATHEKILGQIPQNSLFEIFEMVTHPGDSLSFKHSKPVLCLPIVAPWGSLVQAVEKAVLLKPKIVVPIHDWHLSERAKSVLYSMASEFLAKKNIKFVDPRKKDLNILESLNSYG